MAVDLDKLSVVVYICRCIINKLCSHCVVNDIIYWGTITSKSFWTCRAH